MISLDDAPRSHRRSGRALGALLGLARRPRARDDGGTAAILRARQHRGRGRGRRSAGADRGRDAGLAPARRSARRRSVSCSRRSMHAPAAAGRRDALDAGDVPAGRLEDGQPRRCIPTGARSCSTGRTPAPGPCCWDLGVVPRAQLPAPADEQGGHDRRVPRRARSGAASRPTAGSTSSSICACSGSRRASAGRRRMGDADEFAWWERRAIAGARHVARALPRARLRPPLTRSR